MYTLNILWMLSKEISAFVNFYAIWSLQKHLSCDTIMPQTTYGVSPKTYRRQSLWQPKK